MKKNKTDVKRLTYLALLTAIVILFQLLGQFIHLGPFSASLVLVPIVIGAALLGPVAGAWLGLVFGAVVLCQPDTQAFFTVSVPGTIITVIVKGIAAGFVAGWIFKLIYRFNRYVSAVVAAVICPVVNTGLFLCGCLVFFMDPIREWAAAFTGSPSVGTYMIVGLVGGNFIFEFIINIILVPVIYRVLNTRDTKGLNPYI